MGWLHSDLENRALDYGIDVLSAEHLAEVRSRTLERVAKVKAAVQERLTREVTYWDHRASELQLQTDAGRSPRMNPDRAAARADELQRRKEARLAELDREAQLASQLPVVVGAALVLPMGLIRQATGERPVPPTMPSTPPSSSGGQLTRFWRPRHDLATTPRRCPTATPATTSARALPPARRLFLEVKGRIEGADTFVVTQNELRFAANVPDAYILALVEVSPDGPEHDRVRYLDAAVRRRCPSSVRHHEHDSFLARLLATCHPTTGRVMPTKLIEVALPLDVINREAAREKSIRHGHPSTLHLWWARRPLAACRAVLFAQLVDDPSAHPELFPTEADQERERKRLFDIIERLVPWEASTDEKVLEEARAEIRRCYPDGRLLSSTHSAAAARSRSKRNVSVLKPTPAISTRWPSSSPKR